MKKEKAISFVGAQESCGLLVNEIDDTRVLIDVDEEIDNEFHFLFTMEKL